MLPRLTVRKMTYSTLSRAPILSLRWVVLELLSVAYSNITRFLSRFGGPGLHVFFGTWQDSEKVQPPTQSCSLGVSHSKHNAHCRCVLQAVAGGRLCETPLELHSVALTAPSRSSQRSSPSMMKTSSLVLPALTNDGLVLETSLSEACGT